ncbi:MAG TPA: hypothetical protein VFU16_12660 [Solirubrobacterales bacterium]|nr:hypothetical protein [Solirubrobacterales bacterium]
MFFCGWLTLGILWFVGALAPDPEGSPRDPRWMLAPVAIVAVMLVLGIFGARPTPVLGLDGEALQDSVGNSLLGVGQDSCDAEPGGAWRCWRYDVGYSSVVTYRVKADWKGCWHAVLEGRPTASNPKRRSGCVSLVNYVF